MTDPARRHAKPIVRRDADGSERTAPTWETLTERLIREAQEEGRFDDLPDHGRPLRLDDDVYAGEMAITHHVLRNAGATPPWIEVDKEVRRLDDGIEALLLRARRSPPAAEPRLRRELEELLDARDDAARRLESIAPTPRQQRPRLDRARLRERLEAAFSERRRTP